MHRTVLAFPVKAGATQEEIESIAQMFRSRPDEYRVSRSALGVSLERAYQQPTPMGDFVVAYIESQGLGIEVLGRMAGSALALDKDFARMVNEVHGMDITAPPPAGPPPETIAQWSDPDVTGRRRGLAFCAPLMPGKEDAGRAFAKEAFATRVDEFAASRRAIGDNVEVVTLHETPAGSILCVYLEGNDPVEGNRMFAASDSAYDVWFKKQCATIFPPEIDFNQPLPPIREIFDSETTT